MKMSFFKRCLLVIIGFSITITIYAQQRATGVFHFNGAPTKSALISNSENDGRIYQLIINRKDNSLKDYILTDNYFNSIKPIKNTDAEIIIEVRFAPQSVGLTIKYLTLKKEQSLIQVFIDPLTVKRELF